MQPEFWDFYTEGELTTIMRPPITGPQSAERLDEIQQQVRDICQPQYHEYYKVTTERGFTKITIPKRKSKDA